MYRAPFYPHFAVSHLNETYAYLGTLAIAVRIIFDERFGMGCVLRIARIYVAGVAGRSLRWIPC